MKINKKWQILADYVHDGKPLGLDRKPAKTVIKQRWREEKWRMDYNTHSNITTGNGYHLKGFEDLEQHIKDCLSLGHIIEIHPDYGRPDNKKH